MAIQIRRGLEKDFKPEKMLPGEMAVTTDTKKIFATFAPGDCKQMATYEDMEADIREATGDIVQELTEGVNSVIVQADQAVTNADQSASQALAAKQAADQAAQEAKNAAEEAAEAIKGIGETTGENIVSFTSDDVGPDGDPTLLTVEKFTTGEKLKDLLNKGSRIATNVRYLIKLLGSNDISTLSDGTVTGTLIAMNEALSGKQDEIKLTGSRALVSNSSGKVSVSAVTATKLGYLSNVTSDIQTQINNKNSLKTTDGHLITFAWTGSVLKIYIDGVLAESFTQFRHFDSSATPKEA